MNMLQLALRGFYWLAQKRKLLQSSVEPLFALFEPILQQYLRRRPAGAVIQFGGIDCDGIFDFLEQILVIHDVAENFILAIEAINPAYGLEEPVVLHGFIDIEIRARRRVEAR